MKIPLKKALVIILLVTFIFSGLPALFFLYYKEMQKQRINDPKYKIVALIQASADKEPLKTTYLAELLNLSLDVDSNIYLFNSQLAEHQIRASPLIRKVEVKKLFPSTISVHYRARVPIAFLTDFTNTAIDKQGVIIPFKPFFTPKILPEIYLGLVKESESFELGERIKNRKILLALHLLDYISTHLVSEHSSLKRIDVSEVDASSFGQKEIVVVMEDKVERIEDDLSKLSYKTRILRLPSDDYEKSLSCYLKIQKFLLERELLDKDPESNFTKIIDLRISDLAFIKQF